MTEQVRYYWPETTAPTQDLNLSGDWSGNWYWPGYYPPHYPTTPTPITYAFINNEALERIADALERIADALEEDK